MVRSWSDQILIRMVWYWNGNDVTGSTMFNTWSNYSHVKWPCIKHGLTWSKTLSKQCQNKVLLIGYDHDIVETIWQWLWTEMTIKGSFNLWDQFLAYDKSDWSFWESNISSWRQIRKTINVISQQHWAQIFECEKHTIENIWNDHYPNYCQF